MPSAFDAEFASVALPDLFAQFGESLTRYPLGVAANAVSVTAMFAEDSPSVTVERGIGTRRTATITVASGISVSVKDRWVRSGVTWAAKTIRDTGSATEVKVELVSDEIRDGTTGRLV